MRYLSLLQIVNHHTNVRNCYYESGVNTDLHKIPEVASSSNLAG